MIKRAVLLVLCLILLLPGLAYAEEEHPASLEKPASLSVRSNESGDLLLRLTHP